MNPFHLILLFVASLLFFSPTSLSLRTAFPAPSAEKQVFRPLFSSPVVRGFESEKRKVPTGSNPLHNKRR
ncbi:hypothetical protein CsSME_00026978 [Camellia sinensis var. sinensis]